MKTVNYLQIEPTTRCNYKCKFCAGRHFDQEDITFENFASVLDNFPEVKFIHLQGEGEPFLHKEIFNMIHYANQRNIRVSTHTNGSLLTPEIIDGILKCNIEVLNISIEWPDNFDFFKFRGGYLNKVTEGIANLLGERNKRNLKKPLVGFAFTAMKDNLELLPKIAELYLSLGMDGGISCQFLNTKTDYAQYYDDDLKKQLTTPEEQYKFFLDNAEIINELNKNRPYKHFYEELFKVEIENIIKSRTFSICPWLEEGLYVSCKGYVFCCPTIKDPKKYSFGKIGEKSPEQLTEWSSNMNDSMNKGCLPEQCIECGIAHEVISNINSIVY